MRLVMNGNILKTKLSVLVLAVLFAACQTDVELCIEPEHPHRCELRYEYDWSALTPPETMLVLAKRVIGTYNYAMEIYTDKQTGIYLVHEPEKTGDIENSELSENPDDSELSENSENSVSSDIPETSEEQDSPEPSDNHYTCFVVRSGIYKFLTMNVDETCFIYDDVKNILSEPDENWNFNDVYLKYKTYTKESEEISGFVEDWSDYNSYSDYVMPVKQPVICDTIELRDINEGVVNVCRFSPYRLTQNIDIYFRIKKIIDDENNKPFVIERVKAELSGIPERINPYSGYLDISHTCKILFDMDICDVSSGNISDDTERNEEIMCHANIDVAGVVYGLSPDMNTGPGIMQVVIYAVSPETGMRKKMQGKINLYNTLRAGRLLEYEVDDDYARKASDSGVIDIEQPLTLNGERIINGADNNLGIDWWKEQGRIVIEM